MTRLAIITGASKGIGYATAQRFQLQGWQVVNLSRSACSLNGVKNIAVDFLTADWQNDLLAQLSSLCQPAKQICLIHNAGHYVADTVQTVNQKNLLASLQVNVMIPALLTQMLLPLMPRSSSVIYIGSTLAEKAVPGNLSYVTSKHALAGLMKATCQDLADTGIHTCCICPGITDTEMLRARCHNNDNVLNMLKNMSAARRLIEPTEIADTIFFCANHPVINGSILHANLGQIER